MKLVTSSFFLKTCKSVWFQFSVEFGKISAQNEYHHHEHCHLIIFNEPLKRFSSFAGRGYKFFFQVCFVIRRQVVNKLLIDGNLGLSSRLIAFFAISSLDPWLSRILFLVEFLNRMPFGWLTFNLHWLLALPSDRVASARSSDCLSQKLSMHSVSACYRVLSSIDKQEQLCGLHACWLIGRE